MDEVRLLHRGSSDMSKTTTAAAHLPTYLRIRRALVSGTTRRDNVEVRKVRIAYLQLLDDVRERRNRIVHAHI